MSEETPSVAALPEPPLFGYFTVVDDPVHGMCGGYLVLNHLGRPVEFHCTAAIHPSRAQQILYGPTLRESLFGEQMGPALVAQAKSLVNVILVNQPECIELERHTGQRVVLIEEVRRPIQQDPQRFLFSELNPKDCWATAETGVEMEPLLQLLAKSIDLAEPFQRIREAIYEAQRIGEERRASDVRAA